MSLTWLCFRSMRAVLGASLLMNVALLLLYLETVKMPGAASRLARTPPTMDVPVEERPYIFVGGVPRSGTTLTRVLLDAHPDIRCGQETRLIPRILSMSARWRKSNKERRRLEEAGLNEAVLSLVIRNFISDVMEHHGAPALRLCNKDPLALNHMDQLVKMFPRAKFIMLVRDGRAVAHSIVKRNISITGVDSSSFVSAAAFWNKVATKMWKSCQSLKEACLPVYYEQLVTNPRQVMGHLLQFVNVRWHDNVLKHHQLLHSEVNLSKLVTKFIL